MAEINDLDITDANNTARFPENMAPSAVNDGARALEGLLARWHKDLNASVLTTGTGTAYVYAANQTLSAYYDGLILGVDFHAASGASPTINVDALGAKSLVWPDGTALAANDLAIGSKAIIIYDGTNFQVVTEPAIINTARLAAGAVTGPKIAMGSDAQGDVLYHNGTNYARLGAGTDGQFLKTQGAAANPVWADVGAFTGFSSIELVRKSADETVNNSSTLQNDDTLLVSLAANENVHFTMYLRINSGTTPDFQYAFTVPTAATVGHNFWFGTNPVDETQGSGTPEVVATTGNDQSFVVQGFVANGANAGNLQLQWAQSIANASDTKVLANSYLVVYRV